ncbi:hypothetical protein ACHAWU_006467 [Discostella pseudostelligera]|uniref:Methyltransferase type 11 domain-containing protein n=1 Tax=Discostella pseudostelligera TaxID=259834 RepID=A0ABD3NE77_9STRA
MSCVGDSEGVVEVIAESTQENGGRDINNNTKRSAPAAEDEDGSNKLDNDLSSRPSKVLKKESAPNYGSKEYWEARYKSHSTEGDETITTTYEATAPGHEWYFSYDELQPLIMPLILGESDDEVAESDYDEDAESWVEEEEDDEEEYDHDEDDEREDYEGGCIEESESNNKDNIATTETACSEKEANAISESEHPIVSNCDNATTDVKEANGQAETSHSTSNRPKRVLEVGCGDKPLGSDLVLDLLSLQANSQVDAKTIVDEVTCIDYSDTVVQMLIEKEKKEHEHTTSPTDGEQPQSASLSNLQPTFRSMDARSLPFHSNTYDLILEKGTLDAMLSDKEEGLSNCIQIVKEMARVTSDGGAILIVSHLNANESKGMVWLEDVVFSGLKAEFLERSRSRSAEIATTTTSLERRANSDEQVDGDNYDKEYVWSVEVHGGHGSYRDTKRDNNADADNDVDDDADGEDDAMVYGPAVYIIRKKSIPAVVARELFGKKRAKSTQDAQSKGSDGDDDVELVEMPPVKLSFLSYDGE